MSLRIRFNSQGQTVKSGFVIVGDVDFSNRFDNLHYQEVNHDLMVSLLGNGLYWVIPSDAKPLSEVFSFKGQSGLDQTEMVSYKPYWSDRGIGSRYEARYHANFSRNLALFGSFLRGSSISAPSSKNENPCEHVSYSGELIAGQERLQWTETPLFVYGNAVGTQYCSGDYWRRCTVDTVTPLSVHLVSQHGAISDYDLEELITRMRGQDFYSTVSWNGSIFIRHMSNVDISKTSTGCDITYEMDVVSYIPYSQHYHWTSIIHISFVCAEATVTPVQGNSYNTLYGSFSTFSYSTTIATPFTGAMQRTFTSNRLNHQRAYPTVLVGPLLSSVHEHDTCYDAIFVLNQANLLKTFEKAVRSSWDDIVPASMFSTVDAFTDATGYLGVNLLQNLQKLPGIVNMLPQIGEAIKVLGRIWKRDLSVSTLKDILDLSTSTVLQANFEWRPYHGLLTQYLPSLASTMQSLGDITENAIGYGSYSKTIYNDLSREEVTILARTKLVMDSSPSGLLSAVLGVDALGILPKASNIWDLIPFSFVANWFTGVGSAIRRAEYSLLLMTIPAYFVHTYTITSPFSSEELDSLKMSNSGDEDATLRLYFRDITLYSPIPQDSRFGFGIPTVFPPWGTFGSLLYQLIFS